jgi:hypothetical protein
MTGNSKHLGLWDWEVVRHSFRKRMREPGILGEVKAN